MLDSVSVTRVARISCPLTAKMFDSASCKRGQTRMSDPHVHCHGKLLTLAEGEESGQTIQWRNARVRLLQSIAYIQLIEFVPVRIRHPFSIWGNGHGVIVCS